MKLGLNDIKHLCHGNNFHPLAKLDEFNITLPDEDPVTHLMEK